MSRGTVTLGRRVNVAGIAFDGPGVLLDVEKLVRNRLLVNANSGAGKSWTVRRILEQTHGRIPHHVLDPEGEFHTLREKFDYVLAGKPAGQKGDCPAEPKSAALLARRLLELGVSAVIDLFELDPADRIRFARNYLMALLDAPRALWRPTLVVIDEAHVFCPEKGEGDAESREAVIALMSKGRKRGYGGVLATQRLSKLHKSAAAEANNVLIGRTALDVDLDRAGRALGYDRQQREVLKRLPPGRFHAFGPAISDEVVVVQVGDVATKHPEAGDGQAPPSPPRGKIAKVLAELQSLPEEAAAEARTADELRQRAHELERKLKVAETALAQAAKAHPRPAVDKEAISNAVATATQKAGAEARQHFLREMRKAFGDIESATLKGMRDMMNLIVRDARPVPAPARAAEPPPAPRIAPRSPPASFAAGDVGGPEQKILDALAWFEAIDVPAPELAPLAFIAGYSPNTKSFKNARGSLRSKSLIEYGNDGTTSLTVDGRARARRPDLPATTEAFHKAILEMLPGPERKLLGALLPLGSDGLTTDELAIVTGYSSNTKSFKNARGHLRTLGFVAYDHGGRTRASEIMYPERE